MSRFLSIACLLACLGLAPGCAAVVAGAAAAGTMQYVRNEASRDYPAPLEATWAATLQSLRDRGHPVDPATPYAGGGALAVSDVKVRVLPLDAGRTRVTVRVGTFDTDAHRERARLVLDGVAANLGPGP